MNKIDNLKMGDRIECIKEIIAPDFKIGIEEICKVKDVFSTKGEPFLILIEPERKGTIESMRVWTAADKFEKIKEK